MTKVRRNNRVGVRDLKNSLSAYLSKVKNGATLMVTEHDVVVAELRPAMTSSLGKVQQTENPVLLSWIQDGTITLPVRVRGAMPTSFLSLPNGTAQALLDEDRGE